MVSFCRSIKLIIGNILTPRFVKFLFTGVLAAVAEYSIFIFLYNTATSHLVVSQSFSFLAGFFISFALNRKWVFRSSGRVHRELIKYTILAVVNLILTNLVIWVLTHQLHATYWVAKIIVMAMVAAWNYVLLQKLIFRVISDDEKA